MVLLLLFGGTVADRWPRRRVMLVADVVRCAVQAAVAALLVAGHWHLWELVVLEALWGAGAAFFTPAMSGLLPQMLTGEILAQGNALQALSWLLSSVAGAALAGVMVATAGPGTAVAIDAGTFLVSAAMLASLCLPAVAGRTTATSMLADLRQGWVAFRSRTWLGAIVVEFSLWDLLVYVPVVVPGAVVAKAHLGGAPSWGGHMVSLRGGGAGGRPGGPAFPSSPAPGGRHRGHGRFYPPPRPARGGRPGGAHRPGGRPRRHGPALCGTLWGTTMQQQVPTEVLSPVSAYDWAGSVALLPVGYALAGPMAALIGARTALFGAVAAMALKVRCVLAVPSVRERTAPARPGPG